MAQQYAAKRKREAKEFDAVSGRCLQPGVDVGCCSRVDCRRRAEDEKRESRKSKAKKRRSSTDVNAQLFRREIESAPSPNWPYWLLRRTLKLLRRWISCFRCLLDLDSPSSRYNLPKLPSTRHRRARRGPVTLSLGAVSTISWGSADLSGPADMSRCYSRSTGMSHHR